MSLPIVITLVLIPLILQMVAQGEMAAKDRDIINRLVLALVELLVAHRLAQAAQVEMEPVTDRLDQLAAQVIMVTHLMDLVVLLVVLLEQP